MISVRLETTIVRGKNPITRLDEFERITIPFAQEELIAVANAVKDRMLEIISSGKKHKNKGNSALENNIKTEILERNNNKIDIGVGKISDLNEKAPYWLRLNGGFTPPTTGKKVPLGSFTPEEAPDSAKSGGVWNVGDLHFCFVDKKIHKAVKPFNYIDIAEAEGQRILRSIQKRIENMMKA